ncbi:myosin-7 [Pseudorasbora parva]|uniref:myosin-7 n=1 Tax=Pseudorasbora parva TaxID=51549 RepID=UPI00351F3B77
MKFPALLLGFLLVCSLGIAGYIHSRRKLELHLNKQASFLDIKFRVTRDVLGEYKEQFIQSNTQLEKSTTEVDTLTKDLTQVKSLAAQKTSDFDICKGHKKQYTDEIAASESETKHIQDELVKAKNHWEADVAFLKKQLEQESTLCKYIDKASEEGKKLCNIIEEPPKPKEPQADKANPEEKPEELKPEEKKGDAEQPKVNVQ